jgi:hypothetical protein
VQPPQDNHNNMVKKLEKGKSAPKIASQPPKKQVQNEKDEKVEYVRSVFFNARRPHIKSGIGYKNGDKHNSRVNTKGQEFIKFTKTNVQLEKKQSIMFTSNVSYSYANAFLICHIMILMLAPPVVQVGCLIVDAQIILPGREGSFEKNKCESDCITFGNNSQGQLLGFGKIAITT